MGKPEASHPPTSVMVKAALENLKERKGSSLVAIKKYIGTNYKADPVKMRIFIKKALASGEDLRWLNQRKSRKNLLNPRRKLQKRLLHQSQRRKWQRRVSLQRKQRPRKRLRSPNPLNHRRSQRNLWPRKQLRKSQQQRLPQRRNNLLI